MLHELLCVMNSVTVLTSKHYEDIIKKKVALVAYLYRTGLEFYHVQIFSIFFSQ